VRAGIKFLPYQLNQSKTIGMQFLFFLQVVTYISAVTALPSGAPACNVGAANVQQKHLLKERNPETGPNEDNGYQTILAGAPLLVNNIDSGFFNMFQFGVENTLVIQANPGTYFKGILVIASGGDIDNVDLLDTKTPAALTITDPLRTKPSEGCVNRLVSSVVQTNRTEKTSLAMSFKWPTEGQKLYLEHCPEQQCHGGITILLLPVSNDGG
jgi:hypothetical protein